MERPNSTTGHVHEGLDCKDGGPIAAVVLAAGKGQRMGGRPKCLLEMHGEPLIRKQLHALFQAGITQIVVVLGHYADRIRPCLDDFAVTVVAQLDEEHSQPQSIRLGLAALPEQVRGILVCPSDLPLLTAEDYSDAIAAFDQRPRAYSFVGPEVGGVPGHPVIFDRTVRADVLSGKGSFGCGNWRKDNPEAVLHWTTTNDRYITDVDSEKDRLALIERTGRPLSWPDDLEL